MTTEPERPAIVIAEDDEDVARLLADAVAAEVGADAVVVANGALVIDAVVASAARLLVLDVQMPGASGIDVYDVVRAIPSSPRSRCCSSPPIPQRRGKRCPSRAARGHREALRHR